ncbi:NAD(P)-dependent dehydrogenase, short-chain alcohol dehydrogenase family [Pseudonocardia thermophila]|uniref:NAD(P)-dependent dehydrogenase, short-chain alcohol dehydrogenase family n=1 Tax=Pseudonocardia thermophila TaxID=1848 RepID=A0A1M6S9P0_PSETH|nr:SDR family oxidoreductase [Pseudonocardia thermophila]SHK41494.1 NAD(P)-dependent dehydrogenase, short-chain alcohol dehydrogenase family [Pseudonocardia thermophila]
MTGLADARVVIIGGTSGIGLATARAAVDAGARVVVGGRDPDRLEKAIRELGPAAEGHRVDAASEVEIEAFLRRLGTLDHLLVTPSRLVPAPVVDASTDQVRPALDLRFWAAFHASRYAAPHMSATGSITLLSGIAATRPIPEEAVGGASCAAVEALMRSLVTELAPIRCNVLSPGYVDTPLLDDFFGPARDSRVAAISAALPGRRIGTPAEIADAALFLMRNGYMNGHVLTIDGAHTLV